MDFAFTAEERALALEYRQWLRQNLVLPEPFATVDDEISWGREWQRELAQARWVAIDWPEEQGGRGAGPLDVALVNLEYGRSGAPQLVNRVGLNLAGPTLRAWGTEKQKLRWLPRIVDASEIWCQLFSEPEAGSDLASLLTSADRVPGGWRLNGQKVWNSYAQWSTWGLCLARTDPDATRPQNGISYFALDMSTPGITIRPLQQITREAEFNQVFFDNVFVSDECLIGPEHHGWNVARTTLSHERGTNFPIKEQTVHERYLAAALEQPAFRDNPAARDELARCFVQLRLLTLSNLRTLANLSKGIHPGPESSVTKLQWTALTQRFSRLWVDIAPDEPKAQRQFLWSFAASIAGGTDEVQRTIVGEHLLGLPRARQ
jgi:alkylation response protein AidB-like acyl-CoA dehydrogenase